ncbi:MAG TPA: hypothetical protein VNY80_14540 [Steroidobacteraceae bacterium]|nr:hypothetical protein [Steroidobacteraceae bacterium]
MRTIGVLMMPGHTTVTLMFVSFSSMARASQRPSTACFEAE